MRTTLLVSLLTAVFSGSLAVAGALEELPPVPHRRPVPVSRLQPGVRIRVRSTQFGGRPVSGKLTSLDDAVLRLQTDRRKPPVALARSSILFLEVSEGMHSGIGDVAKLGAWIGGVSGAAYGLGAEYGLYYGGGGGVSPLFTMVVGGAGGALVGGLAGAVLGALVWEEHWRPVEQIGAVQLRFAAARGGGVAASVSVRF